MMRIAKDNEFTFGRAVLLILLSASAVGVCCAWPTDTTPTYEQRIEAWFDLPPRIAGPFPEPNDPPRKPLLLR